jgi:hypothetical protein
MVKNNPQKDSLDILLSKYLAVWLWSISFGALSGLTYSFLGQYYQIGKWGSLSLILVLFMAVGVLAAIRAWLFMFQYLFNYIIPRFLQGVSEENGENDNEVRVNRSSYALRQAFLMMIIALAMRLALEFSILLFSVLQQ